MTSTLAFVGLAGVPAWLVAVAVAAVAVVVAVAATRSVVRELRRRATRDVRATPAFGLALSLGWFAVVAGGGVYLAAPTVFDAWTWGPDATAFAFGLLSTLVAALAAGGVVALRAARGFSVRPLALVSALYPLAYAPAATPHVSGAPVPDVVVSAAGAVPAVAAGYAVLFLLWRRVAAGVDTHVTVDPSTTAPDRETTPERPPDGGDGSGVRSTARRSTTVPAGRPVEDVRVVSESEAAALREAGYPTVESVRATNPGDLADVDGVDGQTIIAVRDADGAAEAADERPLEDVSGVAPATAEALRVAGYASVPDLRAASRADLDAVDGVSDALAARITADVGGDTEREGTETRLSCPNCGTTHDQADPSLRPGDICPDCGRGYVAETERSTATDDAPASGRPLADLEGVGDRQVEALRAAGYDTVEEAQATEAGELHGVYGVGSETVDAIRTAEPAADGDGSATTDRDAAGTTEDAAATDDVTDDSPPVDSGETQSVNWSGLADVRPDLSARFVDGVDDVERANVARVSEAGVLEMQVQFADGREGRMCAANPEANRADADTFVGRVRGWTQADAHDGVVEVLAWGTDPVPWVARPAAVVPFEEADRPDDLHAQVAVAAAVCEAVRHAGLYGTAHYFLSPAALFRGDAGVQVSDWGIADALGPRDADAYAAPEQLGDGEIDTQTTVYRTGATLFWLFTGRAPYDADRADLVDAVRAGEVPRLDAVADVPADVADAVARAMDPDPARRYDSVHHLSLDVQGGVD